MRAELSQLAREIEKLDDDRPEKHDLMRYDLSVHRAI